MAHAPEGSGPRRSIRAKRSARLRRRRSTYHRRERRVRARRRHRRDPLDLPQRTSTRSVTASAAAGRAAASRSATARCSSGQLDAQARRARSETGKVVWSMQAETWQEGFSITSAPLYYDGLVIVGFAGGERGSRGRVKAFDAKDGKLRWTFYTVPGPGELGHDTWPQRQRRVEVRRRARLADAGRRSRARARLLLHRQSGPDLQRRRAARRQLVQRLDRRDRGEDRANTAGTSSRCITTSGTTTRRIPSCCSTRDTTARCAKGSSRSRRRAGSTSSIARPASRSSASRRSR